MADPERDHSSIKCANCGEGTYMYVCCRLTLVFEYHGAVIEPASIIL